MSLMEKRVLFFCCHLKYFLSNINSIFRYSVLDKIRLDCGMSTVEPEIAIKNTMRYSFVPLKHLQQNIPMTLLIFIAPLCKTSWKNESYQNVSTTGPVKLQYNSIWSVTNSQHNIATIGNIGSFRRGGARRKGRSTWNLCYGGKNTVADNIFDVFLSPFSEDIAQL